MDETTGPRFACLMWVTDSSGGCWELRLVDAEGEISPMRATWDPGPPPALMVRYDALATLGYAVVEGGPKAWRWREELTPDSGVLLAALVCIRPLTDRDAAAAGSVDRPR